MDESQIAVGQAVNGGQSAGPLTAAQQQIGDAAQSVGQSGFSFSSDSITLRSHRIQAEIHAIRQALARTGWIRKRAARMLAISYRSLLYKIERYQITPPVAREAQEMMPHPQNPSQTW
jgi:transcriptional regulator with GAF, ATPase, and Fis domain